MTMDERSVCQPLVRVDGQKTKQNIRLCGLSLQAADIPETRQSREDTPPR